VRSRYASSRGFESHPRRLIEPKSCPDERDRLVALLMLSQLDDAPADETRVYAQLSRQLETA
jgi:hypothetical protein